MSKKQINEYSFDSKEPDFSSEPPVYTPPSMSSELEPKASVAGDTDVAPTGEVDREGAMAKADLYKLARYASKLYKKLDDEDQLEAWIQAKITKAADYVASVYHYLEYEMDFSNYGHKLDNAEMMNESVKEELRGKLIEARTKIAELKKLQAAKLEEGKKAKPDFLDLDKDGNKKEPMKKASKEQKCDEMFHYNAKNRGGLPFKKDSESGIKPPSEIERTNKKAGKSQDVLGRRPEGGVAKYGNEYKSMVKGTGVSGKFAKQAYPLGGPKGKLPEELDEFYFYGDDDKKDIQRSRNKPKDELNIRGPGDIAKHGDEYKALKKKGKLGISGPKGKLPEEMNEVSEKTKHDYITKGSEKLGKRLQAASNSGDKAIVSKHLKGMRNSLEDEDTKKERRSNKVQEAAKPSAGLSKKEKSATVKKAKAGGDIGKPGKNFEKVSSKAAKKYGSKEKGEKVAAAAMWKNIKNEDVVVKEAVKKAKKDYDGDGKVESGKDEYLGSKDKAIKKSMGKKCVKESIEHEGLVQQLARILADAGYNSTDITAPEDVAYGLQNNHESMQMWNDIDEDAQWDLVDEIANAVYDLVGSGDEESNPDYGSTRLHESAELDAIKSLTKRLLG